MMSKSLGFFLLGNYNHTWYLRGAIYSYLYYKDIWCLKIVFFARKLTASTFSFFLINAYGTLLLSNNLHYVCLFMINGRPI